MKSGKGSGAQGNSQGKRKVGVPGAKPNRGGTRQGDEGNQDSKRGAMDPQ